MIYLYTPAFIPDSLGQVYVPDLDDLEDTPVDWGTSRSFIMLHDPDYVQGYSRPGKVIMRRSMNDTIRTYVTHDRKLTSHRQITLRFNHLTTDRMKALEHLLISTEGKAIGYCDPDGRFYAALLLNPETAIVVDNGGDTWGDDGEPIVSEWGSAELQLLLIKEG